MNGFAKLFSKKLINKKLWIYIINEQNELIRT